MDICINCLNIQILEQNSLYFSIQILPLRIINGISYSYYIGYITLQIPNTRFKINYWPINFSIIDFLQLLKVRINLINKYMLYNQDLINLISDSYKYDRKIVKRQQFYKLRGYLYTNQNPRLNTVYQIIQPDQRFIRSIVSNIGVQQQLNYINIRHVGINSKQLNGKELQALVDYYYKYGDKLPFYMGYIFYMFYERLHPSYSLNGVVGRTMFVENIFSSNPFPLSPFLCNIRCSYVDDIYKIFSFPQKIETQNDQVDLNDQQNYDLYIKEPENNNKYFSIKLDKEAVSKIILILLFSIIYYEHQNDDNETKELLIKYFQDPFGDNPEFDNIKIENFKEIREMINELKWD